MTSEWMIGMHLKRLTEHKQREQAFISSVISDGGKWTRRFTVRSLSSGLFSNEQPVYVAAVLSVSHNTTNEWIDRQVLSIITLSFYTFSSQYSWTNILNRVFSRKMKVHPAVLSMSLLNRRWRRNMNKKKRDKEKWERRRNRSKENKWKGWKKKRRWEIRNEK